MEGYNIPKDEGYSVPNNYGSTNQNAVSFVYGGEQAATVSLPVYKPTQQQSIQTRSRCPRGAILGQIGSCCGMNCTRACAMPG